MANSKIPCGQVKVIDMDVTFEGTYGSISSEFPANGNRIAISATIKTGQGLIPFRDGAGNWYLGVPAGSVTGTKSSKIVYIE